MNTTRIAAVLLVACGLACVSVSLGLIYIDYREREGRWVQVTAEAYSNREPPDPAGMSLWFEHERAYLALGFGTAGVAMLGAGLMFGVFQLKMFSREKPPPAA